MIRSPLFNPPHRIRVLLVEDDAAACAMYAAALRMEGFDVRTACDGVAALSAMEAFDAQVVILDLKLPVASGFEILDELRSMQCRQPVIAMSGYEPGLSQARRNPEFFAALRKPLDPDDLIGVTRRAVFASC